jgi:hypothetical protein
MAVVEVEVDILVHRQAPLLLVQVVQAVAVQAAAQILTQEPQALQIQVEVAVEMDTLVALHILVAQVDRVLLLLDIQTLTQPQHRLPDRLQ